MVWHIYTASAFITYVMVTGLQVPLPWHMPLLHMPSLQHDAPSGRQVWLGSRQLPSTPLWVQYPTEGGGVSIMKAQVLWTSGAAVEQHALGASALTAVASARPVLTRCVRTACIPTRSTIAGAGTEVDARVIIITVTESCRAPFWQDCLAQECGACCSFVCHRHHSHGTGVSPHRHGNCSILLHCRTRLGRTADHSHHNLCYLYWY